MEPESLLLHLQAHDTCPCPEPDQSNPCPPFHLLKINFNIILPSKSFLKVVSFPKICPLNPSMRLSCLPCVPHALPIYYSLFRHPIDTGE